MPITASLPTNFTPNKAFKPAAADDVANKQKMARETAKKLEERYTTYSELTEAGLTGAFNQVVSTELKFEQFKTTQAMASSRLEHIDTNLTSVIKLNDGFKASYITHQSGVGTYDFPRVQAVAQQKLQELHALLNTKYQGVPLYSSFDVDSNPVKDITAQANSVWLNDFAEVDISTKAYTDENRMDKYVWISDSAEVDMNVPIVDEGFRDLIAGLQLLAFKPVNELNAADMQTASTLLDKSQKSMLGLRSRVHTDQAKFKSASEEIHNMRKMNAEISDDLFRVSMIEAAERLSEQQKVSDLAQLLMVQRMRQKSLAERMG